VVVRRDDLAILEPREPEKRKVDALLSFELGIEQIDRVALLELVEDLHPTAPPLANGAVRRVRELLKLIADEARDDDALIEEARREERLDPTVDEDARIEDEGHAAPHVFSKLDVRDDEFELVLRAEEERDAEVAEDARRDEVEIGEEGLPRLAIDL